MNVSVSEIIRETKNAINARLDLLEMILTSNKSNNTSNNIDDFICSTNKRFENIECILSQLNNTINDEKKVQIETSTSPNHILHVHGDDDNIPCVVIIDKEDNNNINEVYDNFTDLNYRVMEEEQEEEEQEEEQEEEEKQEEEQEEEMEEEEQEEEQEEEMEEEEEQEEEQEEEEQEEEQEEGVELTEFEYKNGSKFITLYHDSDMNVYQKNEDESYVPLDRVYDPVTKKFKKN